MATERLYYSDCYVTQFDAQTVTLSVDGLRVALDRSAFYPASGGQLSDRGSLGGIAVLDVTDDGDVVTHVLASPILAGPVHGRIDWRRRFGFMQQHTGQHLLSSVFHSLFGFETASVHLGEESATIELAVGSVTESQIREAEAQANALIAENRPTTISFEEEPEGLRKSSARSGTLRIVNIAGIDKSACGGTHVRQLGEIGALLIRETEKIRGNTRLAFVCGSKAIQRAREDFDLLTEAGRAFSRPLEDVPAAVRGLQESAKDSAKRLKVLSAELAGYRGRATYEAAEQGDGGIRRHWAKRDGLDDSTRAEAQAFTACGSGIFLATAGAAVLIASSAAGIHCGELLKQFGRGGGTASLAQGTAPEPGLLAAALGL